MACAGPIDLYSENDFSGLTTVEAIGVSLTMATTQIASAAAPPGAQMTDNVALTNVAT